MVAWWLVKEAEAGVELSITQAEVTKVVKELLDGKVLCWIKSALGPSSL